MKYQHAEPADRKAKRIRWAIEKMYEDYPRETIAHVNEKLDAASRGEELRAQISAS